MNTTVRNLRMKMFNDFKKFYSNRNSDNWNFASNYVPEIFESKFIVHWVYGIIEKFPFKEYPLQTETFEDINKRVKIEQEFNVLLKKEELYKPISIKDLAERFKVSYSHKTTDLIPETPGVHYLDNFSISKLKESLKRLIGNSKLNLLIFDAEYHQHHKDLKEEYTDIDLEKYFEIQKIFSFELDTCLFTDNLDWCIITAEDIPMLLGCKKELESEIKQKISLELFQMENEQKMY